MSVAARQQRRGTVGRAIVDHQNVRAVPKHFFEDRLDVVDFVVNRQGRQKFCSHRSKPLWRIGAKPNSVFTRGTSPTTRRSGASEADGNLTARANHCPGHQANPRRTNRSLSALYGAGQFCRDDLAGTRLAATVPPVACAAQKRL